METLDLSGLLDYLKWAEKRGYTETAKIIQSEINAHLYHRDDGRIEREGRFRFSKLRTAEESGVSLRSLYRRGRS